MGGPTNRKEGNEIQGKGSPGRQGVRGKDPSGNGRVIPGKEHSGHWEVSSRSVVIISLIRFLIKKKGGS